MRRQAKTAEPPDALGPRAAGVLLHLSSLPSAHGVGDLGAGARAFAEWLARAGVRWWQMLPVGPIGRGDSPYSSRSAFAGEELFLELDALRRDGLLERDELRAPARARPRRRGLPRRARLQAPALAPRLAALRARGRRTRARVPHLRRAHARLARTLRRPRRGRSELPPLRPVPVRAPMAHPARLLRRARRAAPRRPADLRRARVGRRARAPRALPPRPARRSRRS